ncbi:MAG: Lrp/AsnC family transcriptional regulator [Ignavibacteriae bacterium]|nr:Lrp/AsnC family transcriptional regulator [Ignavibacteriota bacterium]
MTELQKDAHIKKNVLADIVGLSLPSTNDRIQRLESHGYITSYTTVLNHKKLKYDITCFIFVKSESSKHFSSIIQNALKEKEVLECHSVTGEGSHILKIRTQNTTTLEKLLARIQAWPGVTATTSSIVLSTHKETTNIYLNNKNQS